MRLRLMEMEVPPQLQLRSWSSWLLIKDDGLSARRKKKKK